MLDRRSSIGQFRGSGGVIELFKLTCFSGLLDVESVSHVEEVRVDEAECLGHIHLHLGAGVENEFDPSLGTLMSNVVLQCSSDFALAHKGAVDPLIELEGFKSRHFLFAKFIITDHPALIRDIPGPGPPASFWIPSI